MHLALRAIVLAAVVALAACQSKPPPTPTPAPNGVENIRGTERIGWDQRAADTVELGTFRFAIYVDGARSEIADSRCEVTAGANGHSCNGRLPSMTPGQHTLELATFVLDGGTIVESARSAPLRVNVTTSVAIARANALRTGQRVRTADGVQLEVEALPDAVEEPVDLAFDSNGRLFVAERGGTVRVIETGARAGGQRTTTTALTDVDALLSLSLDADFARTRLLYVVEMAAARDGSGASVFRVARYREVDGRLGERAILLDGVAARVDNPSAIVRAGPDGKLYVAFDDGGDARNPAAPASLNGKLLRLNADGTTPDDHGGGTPIHVAGFRSPRGLAFLGDGTLWMADGDPAAPERLASVGVTSLRPRRAALRTTYALEADADPEDAAIYAGELMPALRGDLLVAAGGGYILRVRLDPRLPSRVIASEKLLEGVADAVRAIAVSPDGVIYFATPSTIARLAPRKQP